MTTTSAVTGTRRRGRAVPALPAPLPAFVLALLLAGLTAGCSGSTTGDSMSSSAGGAADGAAAAPARGAAGGARAAADGATGQAVISTGSVELTADDVPDARLDVLTVVARYGGQVADEQTTTSSDRSQPTSVPEPAAGPVVTEDATQDATGVSAGPPDIARTHLVVRIPSRSFARAMTDLSGIGHFVASSRQATDVTTEVIDVRARVRVQARSVARIERLLDRAVDLTEIVAVESQLSRRQADLESLRQRATYLRDRTSLSTVTVDLSRRTAADRSTEHSAFVGGLAAGWHGLTVVLGGLLALVGALLPFLLVLGPLGLLAWLLRGRVSRPRGRSQPRPESG